VNRSVRGNACVVIGKKLIERGGCFVTALQVGRCDLIKYGTNFLFFLAVLLRQHRSWESQSEDYKRDNYKTWFHFFTLFRLEMLPMNPSNTSTGRY
jgi:hypothetical protein